MSAPSTSTRLGLIAHALTLALGAGACSQATAPGMDGDVPPDVATDAASTDAADAPRTTDAAPGGDAGSAHDVVDAGSAPDATMGVDVQDLDMGATVDAQDRDAVMAADAPVVMDAGSPTTDAGSPPADAGCVELLNMPGLLLTSTADAPRRQIPIPQPGPTTWHRIEVSLDVYLAGWTSTSDAGPQGQYEVFTLLAGQRWVGGAVGYIAFVGPSRRQTVMVANLGLAGAAAPDGRRVTRSYPYQPGTDYHLEYSYDTATMVRRVEVDLDGGLATSVQAATVVSQIDVPSSGFLLLLGGREVDGAPDRATLGWRFSNAVVRGCP